MAYDQDLYHAVINNIKPTIKDKISSTNRYSTCILENIMWLLTLTVVRLLHPLGLSPLVRNRMPHEMQPHENGTTIAKSKPLLVPCY